MKRLFRIFELSKNEQRVVLIVSFILITVAFVGHERRLNRAPVQQAAVAEAEGSPTPIDAGNER